MPPTLPPPEELQHWADIAAQRTIQANPGVSEFTVASGITPSGVVHIGNFREVITVDFVARALADRGMRVRFIYSWDDFDVFRKVPEDAPQREMLLGELRRSIADVPDPWGGHDSWASHHIAEFEAVLPSLGIQPEFIRQSRRYRAGAYAEGIRKALELAPQIRTILDRFRDAPLAETWLPIAGFLGAHGDAIDLHWDGAWGVTLEHAASGTTRTVDLREGGDVKLPWRVDWPMRWAHERVHFEPGGKDHSSAGGSYDTAKDIVQLFGWKAPEYVAYDFVRIKGAGGKISSSKGGATTVADCLGVYEPQLLRWIFASYRPNTEFHISFDGDVIKIYEDFDRMVRLAHEAEDGTDKDRKRATARRILQLADIEHRRIEPGSPAPFLPPFRGVSMVLQALDGDVERAVTHYTRSHGPLSGPDEHRLRTRLSCARRWLEQHAPDEFCFRVRDAAIVRALDPEVRAVLARLVDALATAPDEADEAALVPHLKALFEGSPLGPNDFFPVAYDLLLGRDRGPKLSTLLSTIGPRRAQRLLEPSLAAAT